MNYLSCPFLLFLTLNEKISKAIAKTIKIKKKSEIWETTHKCLSLSVEVEVK